MEEEGWGLAFPVKLSHEPTMLSPLTDIRISATPPSGNWGRHECRRGGNCKFGKILQETESFQKLSSYVHMERVNPTTHWIPGTLRRVAYQPFYRRRMPSRN